MKTIKTMQKKMSKNPNSDKAVGKEKNFEDYQQTKVTKIQKGTLK